MSLTFKLIGYVLDDVSSIFFQLQRNSEWHSKFRGSK